ncbi:hypothetical protein AURDEDRAFT_63986 [Auricularia subglabra TFB-10046 SS5]|nr:hypothetical protein AURDEDRAFT_63986 [Auricularia subglabra TFB-10046 SS5]
MRASSRTDFDGLIPGHKHVRVEHTLALCESARPSLNTINVPGASKVELLAEVAPATFPAYDQDLSRWERATARARRSLQRLTTYARAIQSSQQRGRVFGFIVCGTRARLVCHSHFGPLVTRSFDLTHEPHLHEFLWRLTHIDDNGRGFDDTVRFANVPEARRILGLDAEEPLYAVDVGDKTFYVSRPFSTSVSSGGFGSFGQGTRCFTAYDPSTGGRVLLKDTWCTPVYEREHLIYARLSSQAVRHVPAVLAAGDVPSQTIRLDGHQVVHYRLVLDIVGESLSHFKSSHELFTVLRDAFEAHSDAYHKAGILHSNITYGNIILHQGRGLLIDWQRARPRSQEVAGELKPIGTRRFQSILTLADRTAPHRLADDIEAFIHVALWTCGRHAANSMSEAERAQFVDHFDHPHDAAWRKLNLIGYGAERVSTMRLVSPQLAVPLRNLAGELLHSRYIPEAALETMVDRGWVQPNGRAEALQALKERTTTHAYLLRRLQVDLTDEAWQLVQDPAIPSPSVELR